jgi:threonyl-tRNA synthetase
MVDLQSLPREERLYRMRHSAAHVMADVVLEMFPEGKFGIGPPVENGFYYDFDLPRALTPDDLDEVERRMRDRLAEGLDFEHEDVPAEDALRLFADQPYKVELIQDIGEPSMSLYRHGRFTDLCQGPHVNNTREVPPFKLVNVAGAYWRGSEKNAQLQRIYGVMFETQAELDEYFERLEEARRRDHRKVGRELELFASYDEIGAGLPSWLPKGAAIRHELEQYIYEKERRAGYLHVVTPDVAKTDVYVTSGHILHYKDSMFPIMELENESLVLRPMNCPHHIVIYQHGGVHSYRDLPIRIAEYGTMWRYEKSGELSGLNRVRAMTLNDAHIFALPEQIESEFSKVVQLILEVYRDLGIEDYWFRLSFRDKADTAKYVQNDAMWEMGQARLVSAMDALGLPYQVAEGEAAFYGPKLDVQLPNILGKDETVSTIQIDFHLPNQFELEYIGEDGQPQRPVIIHRGIIGTFERMIAHLIELYGGAFPVWLAPVQALVIPIADRHNDYAQELAQRFIDEGLRVEVNAKSDRMNAKIRDAQLQKVPYMLVVGDKEIEAGAVAVRLRSGENLGPLPVDEVLARMQEDVRTKARW